MNVLQHALLTKLAFHGDESTFNKIIPCVLLPDAITYYTEIPQVSHFERNVHDSKCSYMVYPDNPFELSSGYSYKNKESEICHLESDYNPYPIGGDIDLDACSYHTVHLNSLQYKGIRLHLQQDIVYRKFLRDIINCTNESNGIFQFEHEIMNHMALPILLEDIEQWGIYVLAYMLDSIGNIIPANQQWFDDVVINRCFSTYPYLMADYLYKRNEIRKDINSYITNKDWSHFDEMPISFDKYESMYKESLHMNK